jgi:cytochrome b561
MPSRSLQRYTGVARLLHWTMAALVLMTIPVGFVLLALPQGWVQNTLFDLHRSIGVLLFMLVVVRGAWRLTHPPPPLPDDLSAWQRIASGIVHRLLYAILLIQPIIGWWGTSAFGAPINVFWLFELPPLVSKDEAAAKQILAWHDIVGITFSVTIAIHVSAALFHHFVRRDEVLRRML